MGLESDHADITALLAALPRSHLTQINLACNHLNDEAVRAFTRICREDCAGLHNLDLSGQTRSSLDTAVIAELHAVLRHNTLVMVAAQNPRCYGERENMPSPITMAIASGALKGDWLRPWSRIGLCML